MHTPGPSFPPSLFTPEKSREMKQNDPDCYQIVDAALFSMLILPAPFWTGTHLPAKEASGGVVAEGVQEGAVGDPQAPHGEPHGPRARRGGTLGLPPYPGTTSIGILRGGGVLGIRGNSFI